MGHGQKFAVKLGQLKRMEYQEEIKSMLLKSNAEDLLRNFALKLYLLEKSKKKVYKVFDDYYDLIIDEENETALYMIGDVLDMIWGTYSGKNIDFENELHDSDLS
jgi:hypothetical protein